MYSESMLECATVDYLYVVQEIISPVKMNMYSVVDFRSFLLPAQLASEKPKMVKSLPNSYKPNQGQTI